MNNLKLKKRRYNLHRSNNFTLPSNKGIFSRWEFEDTKHSALLLIDGVVFTDYLNIFDIQKIREQIRNLLPIDKDTTRLFNLERIIQKDQLSLIDFFSSFDKTILDSTINNLKLNISFQFKNPPKKVKIIEYYYEIPKIVSRPIGKSIEITPNIINSTNTTNLS